MRMNKKGLSQLADIVFSLILFTCFFVILMLIIGTAKMQVHAEITAANTAFICQNDLSAAMQFPSDGEQIKDILVKEYIGVEAESEEEAAEESAEGEANGELTGAAVEEEETSEEPAEEATEESKYPKFDSEIKSIFNDVAGENKWEIRSVQGEEELHRVGEQKQKNSETCSVLVPVPCDTSGAEDEVEYEKKLMKCNLEVQLRLGYE